MTAPAGELRSTVEHIERAKLELSRASVCHGDALDEVQRELLSAQAALTRARAMLLRGRTVDEAVTKGVAR